jgi:hypothetical protein
MRKKKTHFEVRLYPHATAGMPSRIYDDHTVLSSHASVDVAEAKRLTAGKKHGENNISVVACTPFGDATVFSDELWKWGSKLQSQPWHMRGIS